MTTASNLMQQRRTETTNFNEGEKALANDT